MPNKASIYTESKAAAAGGVTTFMEMPNTRPNAVNKVELEKKYDDYEQLGSKIKCNPAIKDSHNKDALWAALLDDRLDIIATDHAPHTSDEKSAGYLQCPSGVPLVQHSINIMLDAYHKGMITKETMIEKMCHAPAECFNVIGRGYLRQGYQADIVILDPDKRWTVEKSNIYYRCNWSPLEGRSVCGQVLSTIVNGQEVYTALDGPRLIRHPDRRLTFNR
ncbi:UNVERIFIED_CONTAM: hypothetical protein GTU68_058177 [Idotea baltica]|nr:hypothetical protein [Idotea baltica]